MATLMDSTISDNNYGNNMFTYITMGNLQLALPPSISIRSLPDGRIFLINSESNEMDNKTIEMATENTKNSNINIDELCLDKLNTISEQNEKRTETFTCETCSATFQKLNLYKKHMLYHRNMKKFKCDQCYESFNIEDNYKIHLAMHSKGQPRCPICDRTFQRLASLKSHLLVHQVDETYTCQECFAEFEKSDEYSKHMDKHKEINVTVQETNIPYVCSYCNYTFQEVDTYKEHISCHIKVRKLVYNNKKCRKKATVKRNFPYKCTQCAKSFSKVCLLERHLRIHSGEKPFICEYCNRGFSQKGTLQIHLAKHTGQKPFSCCLCPAKFCQKGNLRIHVERAHTAPSNGEKLYTCNQCTCIFKKVASLNAHITRSHSGAKKSDVVDVIERLKEIESFMPTNTTDIEKPFDLSLLNEETNARDSANKDKQSYTTIHSNINGVIRKYIVKHKKIDSIRWYICSYCSKEFKKPSDLIRHIRTHTKEKPFQCSQCDVQFSLKSTLDTHLKTHSEKKDYSCLLCSKIFSSARSFNLHLRKHDKNNSKAKQYKCLECNKIFNSVTKANIHMTIHNTRENVITNKDKPVLNEFNHITMKQPLYETGGGFLPVAAPKPKIPSVEFEQYKNRPCKCQHCPAAFTRLVHLKRHLLTHTGERKFICDYCPKSFYTSYALKEHVNFHKGIKNFACPTCNKRFVTKTILKRHMIMHTTYKPYVCPYCKKRFKSVTLCRRHINIHKREVNLQIQALSETGELNSNLPMEEEPNKIIDFVDALSDNVFTVSDIMNQNMQANEITEEQGNVNMKPTVNEMDKNDCNYLNNETFPTTEDISITENNTDQNFYSIYVNYDNMQVLSASDYNSLLSQMKVESNDPMFLNNLQELQDSNVLLSLSQANDFTNDNQNYDSFNSNFMLNTIDELNEKEQQMLSCLPETANNSRINNEKLLSVDDTLTENLVIFNDPKNDLFAQNVDDPMCKSSNFYCHACKLLFETFNDMQKHECISLTNKNNESVIVENNSALINNNSTVAKNVKVKHKNKNTLINKSNEQKCNTCGKMFSTKLALYRHSAIHNIKKEVKNVCSYCEKMFKKPSDLQRHIRTHTGEKPFKCEKCDKSFTLKSTRDSHYRTHNPGSNREFNCIVCNFYFCSKSSLKTHMLKHTGAKPFACHLCPAKFRTSGQRKSHVENHSKKAQLKVAPKEQLNLDQLSNIFTINQNETVDDLNAGDLGVTANLESNDNLQINFTENGECLNIAPLLHLQSGVFLLNDIPTESSVTAQNLLQFGVEDDTAAPLVNIQTLDLSKITENDNFSNNNGVVTFDATNVNLNLEEEIIKPFKCDVCDKRFQKRFLLNKHLKSHGLNLPFSCTKCKKRFADEEFLEKHLQSHSGYRPYLCHLCNNSFSEEGSLKIHLKRLHSV